MRSFAASTVGAVWSQQLAICSVSASPASVGLTARTIRGVNGAAKMEGLASKTHPTLTCTAAAAPCISLEDTVRTPSLDHTLPALTCSVSSSLGIKCVTISVTTTSVSGMGETALSTGGSRGPTAPQVFPAGIISKMDVVTRSVTTLDVYLTALSVRRPNQPLASM